MTIACCYVSPEGVVLGADSTASLMATGFHYFNHAQKIFEIGEEGTLGLVTWGLSGLQGVSTRTLVAELGDQFALSPPFSVPDAMARWITLFDAAWANFSQHPAWAAAFAQCRALGALAAFDPTGGTPNARTLQQEQQFQELVRQLTVGFCIGGRVPSDRTPAAYFVHYNPMVNGSPTPTQIGPETYRFWGAPNMIDRLIGGADHATREAIVRSGHWSGSAADLNNVLSQYNLAHPVLPLREAIDFVHSCIYSTIKAFKFSYFPQVCGGPIELAVVSTDRRFRWVRHKSFDTAVVDGDFS